MGQDSYLVGGATRIVPSPEVASLLQERGETSSQLSIYYKLQLAEKLFYSAQYERVKSRNSYTVSFLDNQSINFGQIQYFCVFV